MESCSAHRWKYCFWDTTLILPRDKEVFAYSIGVHLPVVRQNPFVQTRTKDWKETHQNQEHWLISLLFLRHGLCAKGAMQGTRGPTCTLEDVSNSCCQSHTCKNKTCLEKSFFAGQKYISFKAKELRILFGLSVVFFLRHAISRTEWVILSWNNLTVRLRMRGGFFVWLEKQVSLQLTTRRWTDRSLEKRK